MNTATTTGSTAATGQPAALPARPRPTGRAGTTGRPTAPPTARPTARSGPPGRRDPRRPGTARSAPLSPAAAAAARLRERARQPHHWFALRLLLTLSGQRPIHLLLGHALPAAYDRLVELAPLTPLRPRGNARPTPVLHRCGGYRPRDGVIEAFALIATGDRLSALAFRLELGPDARWRCAAVDLGPSYAVPARQ